MKSINYVFLFVVFIFLLNINLASATVQPIVNLNQSNDFINQYSEMNFTITEYSGQKSLQYLNLTIPSGYILSVPAPGFQIGTWNNTDAIIVASPTTFTIGTTGNITLYGNILNLHMFNGDNPFAVNTADSTVILSLHAFAWQNPSAQGVYIWNYTSLLAGDPQPYTSFFYKIIRDYSTNINNTFNNQYVSCSANVTVNNNNTLGVLVNFSSEINNTNLNINNITLQTSINNSNEFNLSIDLSNNNSIAIINANNNTIFNINNNSITNIISCDNNNTVNALTYFNGTNILNASFWLTNNNTINNVISCDSNSSAWISAMFNNTNIFNASMYLLNNNTNMFNASFDVSNNNSINVIASFNNTNTFNMTFDMSNNNTIMVVNDVNATANCMQNQSNYNNVTIIFNNTVLCSSNSSTWIDASNQTTNYNVSLFSTLFSNTTLNMLFNMNNSFNYNISFNLNNTFITNINNTNILNCNPQTNASFASYFNPDTLVNNTYWYLNNNSVLVNIPSDLCKPTNVTVVVSPDAVNKDFVEKYWPVGFLGLFTIAGLMYVIQNRKKKPEVIDEVKKSKEKQHVKIEEEELGKHIDAEEAISGQGFPK